MVEDSHKETTARDVRPVPDPTALTTQQLLRENLWLREVLETRLDGMDKAITLLQDTADKFPDRIDEKIASLREVHEEKFRSIEVQFSERDVRTEQTAKDSKVAVDAALQAAKELVSQQNTSNSLAIAKSEAAVTKQIDQQGTLIQTTAKASDDKIDDLKQRITRLEERDETKAKVVTTQQAQSGLQVGWLSFIAPVNRGR